MPSLVSVLPVFGSVGPPLGLGHNAPFTCRVSLHEALPLHSPCSHLPSDEVFLAPPARCTPVRQPECRVWSQAWFNYMSQSRCRAGGMFHARTLRIPASPVCTCVSAKGQSVVKTSGGGGFFLLRRENRCVSVWMAKHTRKKKCVRTHLLLTSRPLLHLLTIELNIPQCLLDLVS